MRKIKTFFAALLLAASANAAGYAQNTDKKDGEKPPATTADAWRQAIPQSEPATDAALIIVAEESRDNVETRETPAQIEKRILELQQRLMSSLKQRDAVTLNHLLADEFTAVGADAALGTALPDKARFIQWALKSLELKSYDVEKITVRVFASAAVVTTEYKRLATVAGAPSDGSFTVTDVWVRRAKRWQAVSHHISRSSKP